MNNTIGKASVLEGCMRDKYKRENYSTRSKYKIEQSIGKELYQ